MKNTKSVLINGFLIWLIPFVASFFIYTWRETDRTLFETVMPIILVTSIMFVIARHSKNDPIDSVSEGLRLGLIWMVLNLLLDSFVFIWGPLKMELSSYIKDIGLIYILIPIITAGVGKLHKTERVEKVS